MLLRKMHPFVMLTAALGLLLVASPAVSEDAAVPIRFYLDADRTNETASGDAIEAGMRVAVSMQGGRVFGRPVEFVMLDHRGNTRRSKRSLEKFAADPNGLVIFTGLHSPPILHLRDTINRQKLLMLDPWAAAGPITRPESEENWIFRLSVDDANAGQFIVESAMAAGIQRPGLLLEETGWGKANNLVMTRTVVDALGREPARRWFSWGNSEQALRLSLTELIDEDVDAIFFVGNTPEGAKLIKILAAWAADVRPVLYSHWGILGGGLLNHVTREDVQAVDLKFIQTRFDLGTRDEDALPQRAFAEAKRLGFFEANAASGNHPDRGRLCDIDRHSGAGLVTAYRRHDPRTERTGAGCAVASSGPCCRGDP